MARPFGANVTEDNRVSFNRWPSDMPHIEFSESADLRDYVKFSVKAGSSVLFFIVCIGRKRQAI
jgi:hypothetical protein